MQNRVDWYEILINCSEVHISFGIQKSQAICIGPYWPMTQVANGHLGQSQMANSGLLRPVMSSGLKSPTWSTQ